MKFEKPGPHKKKKEKMPKPPVELYCRKCHLHTKTERWCHAESKLIKFEHGGGITGGRIPHSETAWLCMLCDSKLSQPLPKNATQQELEEHAAEWRRLINLSH